MKIITQIIYAPPVFNKREIKSLDGLWADISTGYISFKRTNINTKKVHITLVLRDIK